MKLNALIGNPPTVMSIIGIVALVSAYEKNLKDAENRPTSTNLHFVKVHNVHTADRCNTIIETLLLIQYYDQRI